MLRPGVPERLTLPFPGRILCPAPTASEGGAAARSEGLPRHGFVAAPDRRLVAQREANPPRYRHLARACIAVHQDEDGETSGSQYKRHRSGKLVRNTARRKTWHAAASHTASRANTSNEGEERARASTRNKSDAGWVGSKRPRAIRQHFTLSQEPLTARAFSP